MTTLVKDQPSTSQTPDVFGILKEVAEFGPEAGERLRAARDNLGLTQREAANRLGITEKTLSKWELAKSKPTRHMPWDKIEEVYGVSRREILGEPEPAQLDRIEQMLQKVVEFINSQDAGAESELSTDRPTLPSQRTKRQGNPAPRKRAAES